MKTFCLFISSLIIFCSVSAYAVLPPKYLSVPEWQSCTDTYYRKGAEFVCLPIFRPHHCPRSSWHKLNKYRMLDRCPGGAGSTGMGSSAPQ